MFLRRTLMLAAILLRVRFIGADWHQPRAGRPRNTDHLGGRAGRQQQRNANRGGGRL